MICWSRDAGGDQMAKNISHLEAWKASISCWYQDATQSLKPVRLDSWRELENNSQFRKSFFFSLNTKILLGFLQLHSPQNYSTERWNKRHKKQEFKKEALGNKMCISLNAS